MKRETRLLIACITVLLIAGLFTFTKDERSNPSSIDVSKSQAPFRVDVSPISTWKSCTNKAEGYEIKFPSTWIVVGSDYHDGPGVEGQQPMHSDCDSPYTRERILIGAVKQNQYTKESFLGDSYVEIRVSRANATATDAYIKSLKDQPGYSGEFSASRIVIANEQGYTLGGLPNSSEPGQVVVVHNGRLYELTPHKLGATFGDLIASFDFIQK